VFLLAIHVWKCIFRVINSKRMRWAVHLAGMEEKRDVHRVLMGNHLGDLVVDERTILIWIFRKWDVGIWLGIGTVSGHL